MLLHPEECLLRTAHLLVPNNLKCIKDVTTHPFFYFYFFVIYLWLNLMMLNIRFIIKTETKAEEKHQCVKAFFFNEPALL